MAALSYPGFKAEASVRLWTRGPWAETDAPAIRIPQMRPVVISHGETYVVAPGTSLDGSLAHEGEIAPHYYLNVPVFDAAEDRQVGPSDLRFFVRSMTAKLRLEYPEEFRFFGHFIGYPISIQPNARLWGMASDPQADATNLLLVDNQGRLTPDVPQLIPSGAFDYWARGGRVGRINNVRIVDQIRWMRTFPNTRERARNPNLQAVESDGSHWNPGTTFLITKPGRAETEGLLAGITQPAVADLDEDAAIQNSLVGDGHAARLPSQLAPIQLETQQAVIKVLQHRVQPDRLARTNRQLRFFRRVIRQDENEIVLTAQLIFNKPPDFNHHELDELAFTLNGLTYYSRAVTIRSPTVWEVEARRNEREDAAWHY